jgi:hypothetical protein
MQEAYRYSSGTFLRGLERCPGTYDNGALKAQT